MKDYLQRREQDISWYLLLTRNALDMENIRRIKRHTFQEIVYLVSKENFFIYFHTNICTGCTFVENYFFKLKFLHILNSHL